MLPLAAAAAAGGVAVLLGAVLRLVGARRPEDEVPLVGGTAAGRPADDG